MPYSCAVAGCPGKHASKWDMCGITKPRALTLAEIEALRANLRQPYKRGGPYDAFEAFAKR